MTAIVTLWIAGANTQSRAYGLQDLAGNNAQKLKEEMQEGRRLVERSVGGAPQRRRQHENVANRERGREGVAEGGRETGAARSQCMQTAARSLKRQGMNSSLQPLGSATLLTHLILTSGFQNSREDVSFIQSHPMSVVLCYGGHRKLARFWYEEVERGGKGEGVSASSSRPQVRSHTTTAKLGSS